MDDPYAALREHFVDMPSVTVTSGRGVAGIKAGGKMPVMFYKGELLVKLPPDRVRALTEAGVGQPQVLTNGKVMADRLQVPVEQQARWIEIAEESLRAGG